MGLLQTLDSDLQRSSGAVMLELGAAGTVVRMREEGSAKLRLPSRHENQNTEAIIINTSGGLASGDTFEITARAAGDLCLTTQAAEKIYCALSSATCISTRLGGEGNARLLWLPQETILFDGARLVRSLDVNLSGDATLLAVETVILGRKAMGENLSDFLLRDRWRIRRDGRMIHADDICLDPSRVVGAAALGGATAFASLIFAGPDADIYLGTLREIIGDHGGASAWDGKLVARLVGVDGFDLRKTLIPALMFLAAPTELPKVWTL